jgi:hypothetical protein
MDEALAVEALIDAAFCGATTNDNTLDEVQKEEVKDGRSIQIWPGTQA